MLEVNRTINASPTAKLIAAPALLSETITAFVQQNEDPSSSPNLDDESADDLQPLIRVLSEPAIEDNEPLLLLVLKSLKVLSRKYENRIDFGQQGCEALVQVLKRVPDRKITAEGCNVVLNICYEKSNVHMFIEAGGISALVTRLAEEDSDLQANAAGALQSITFQEKGRTIARDDGAVPLVVKLLTHANQRVSARAIGALHNMSTDEESIRIVRRQGGIPTLVHMLGCPEASICGSAVGTIQNISREVQSCEIIKEHGGIAPLCDLLFATDVQAQVAASGALLNIFGHPTADEDGNYDEATAADVTSTARQALRRLFTSSLVLGITFNGIGFGGCGAGLPGTA
eukprot:SAG22_NODE_701_length_7790_cov_3.878689_2_plen_344_part_00